jgi:hypothetical protein
MSQLKHARVIREFSLPVGAFDYLKGCQRAYQLQAIDQGKDLTVTNSAALERIIGAHYNLGTAATRHGLSVDAFCVALLLGDLVAIDPTAPVGKQA